MGAADSLLALGLVITFAAIIGSWASFFRLPLILSYILSGIILGPLLLNPSQSDNLLLLQDLGLSFLLFLVGLEIKTSDLKFFGKQSLILGFVQVLVTAVLAFVFALILGFSGLSSFYVAVALTFSSTVVVVKLLTEKRDLDSLYGKLTIAALLIQDVAAIFILILLPAFGKEGSFNISSFVITLLVGFVLVSSIYYSSKKLLPYLFERVARNLELLFLTSISWLLLISAISAKLGFSLEIGAFLAGLGLAALKEEHQIAARIRPLRDFFVVIFFVILGSSLAIDFKLSTLVLALLLSSFVLIAKPLIVITILGRLGFRKRTGFMSGLSLAQVSEFSLIIMFLGLKAGFISNDVVSIITLTALITIAVSSYLLVFATKIYRGVEKYLVFFETETNTQEQTKKTLLSDHVVLIGCNRLGWEVLKQLQKQDKKTLVIDFNPQVINALKETEVEYLFGDVTDPEIWEQANIAKASVVISTVFDPDDTLELLDSLKSVQPKPVIFVTSAERDWAVKFYNRGADYVIVPRVLSGHQVAHLLTNQKLAEIREGHLKKEHLEELRIVLDKLAL